MSEHKHGEMDISVQEKTFNGFINFTIKSVVVILIAVVLLALIGA
ncbi:aa3-type cytochrome c oxidase subunit IV [Primorskyibacter sp. S187A]